MTTDNIYQFFGPTLRKLNLPPPPPQSTQMNTRVLVTIFQSRQDDYSKGKHLAQWSLESSSTKPALTQQELHYSYSNSLNFISFYILITFAGVPGKCKIIIVIMCILNFFNFNKTHLISFYSYVVYNGVLL